MDSRPPRLIPSLVCLLALGLSACLPPTEEEKERAEAARRAAMTPTPTPPPKPGAWMHEKRENPLDVKDRSLNQKPKK